MTPSTPSHRLPPGPGLPPEEQTFAWFARPLAFLEENRERHGETFTLNFQGLGPHVFVTAPKDVQTIFTGPAELLRAGGGNEILRPFLGPKSLLVLDGEDYGRHRKLMVPPFHPKRLESRYPALVRSVAGALKSWPGDRPLLAMDAALDLSLAAITSALFGESAAGRHAMERLLRELLSAVSFSPVASGGFARTSPEARAWEKFRRGTEALNVLLDDAVRAGGTGAILEELLVPGAGGPEPLSPPELRDELVTLLIAGHETTATALAWAFQELILHPEVLERLSKEVRALPDPAADIPPWLEAPYLDAVVKETLRLHPPIPVVSRRLAASFTVGPWNLPGGIHVVPCIYLAHRREEIFPSPEAFSPERFLDRAFSPYEYFPFGGGLRRCLGMAFATAELKFALGMAARERKLAPAQARGASGSTASLAARPVRRSVVIVPAGGVPMTAVPW